MKTAKMQILIAVVAAAILLASAVPIAASEISTQGSENEAGSPDLILGTTTEFTITTSAGTGGTVTPTMTVPQGENALIFVTLDDGYRLGIVTLDGESMSPSSVSPDTRTALFVVSNVQADHSVVVTFIESEIAGQYIIEASAGAGGYVNHSGSVPVRNGDDAVFEIIPKSGYVIDQVLVDEEPVTLTGNTYTFHNVTSDHTIHVTFKASGGETPEPQWTITASAGSNGSISPDDISVADGDSASFTITPNDGYVIDQVLVDGKAVTLTGNSYTFHNVTSDHTIHVTFKASGGDIPEPESWMISASAGPNGSINPPGNVFVESGTNQTFTISPNDGYVIDQVLVDGTAVTLAGNSYTFQNVTSNHTISVTFKASGGETPEPQWTITASAGSNGSISPGDVSVQEGSDQTFTITPNDGYEIDQVLVDGTAVTLAGNTYTFQNVTSDHTISVTFKETSAEPVLGENSGDDNTMYYIIAAIILILVIIAVVYYIMRNKH